MKTYGLLITLALVAVLGMSVTASAQCLAVLADGLYPNGGTVLVGETIEYVMTVGVPAGAEFCELHDVDVYFFPPPGNENPCDDIGAGIHIKHYDVIAPGDTHTLDSSDDPALAHVVIPGWLTDADLEDIKADMATTFYISAPGGDIQCDESSSVVTGVSPCIEVTKHACEYSKVGDTIMYTICVTNCSVPPTPLENVIVADPMLGGTLPGFLSILEPDQEDCVNFDYVVLPDDLDPLENTVEVTGEDADGHIVTDTDLESVTLLHPSFSILVECMTDPVAPGGDAHFDITFTNDGDVDLDISTDDAGIAPFTLDSSSVVVRQAVVGDPGDVECVEYEINVLATIPSMYCDLTNEYDAYGMACCPVEVEGEDGCTPGYWKNQTECWECYTTTTTLGEVFTFPTELAAFEDYTLLQALKFGGGTGLVGKTRNLMRHASAALQNACDPDVAYPMGLSGVIDAVNNALALGIEAIQDLHGDLEMYNEYGCPQDAHCNPITEEVDDF